MVSKVREAYFLNDRYLNLFLQGIFILLLMVGLSVKANAALYNSSSANSSESAAYSKWVSGGALTPSQSTVLAAYFMDSWQFGRVATDGEAGFVAEYLLASQQTSTLNRYDSCDISYPDVEIVTPAVDGDGNPVFELDGDGNPILDGDGDPVQVINITYEPYDPPKKSYGFNDGIDNDANILDCVKNEFRADSVSSGYTSAFTAEEAEAALQLWYETSAMGQSTAKHVLAYYSMEMVYDYMDSNNTSFYSAYRAVYRHMFPECFYGYYDWWYSPTSCVDNQLSQTASDLVALGPPGCDNESAYSGHPIFGSFIAASNFAYCAHATVDGQSVESAQAQQEAQDMYSDVYNQLEDFNSQDFSLGGSDYTDFTPGSSSSGGSTGGSSSAGSAPDYSDAYSNYLSSSAAQAEAYAADFESRITLGAPTRALKHRDPFGPPRFNVD